MQTDHITLGLSPQVNKLGYVNYQALYQDWCDNFSTLAGFASHHGIAEETALKLLNNAFALYGG